MKEVSAAAGVSTATVSRVLAGFDAVSQETRQRVLAAVDALNYRPNRTARNLRQGATSRIGMIISDIQNPFFGSVVRGVEKCALQDDYILLLGNSDENPHSEQKLITMMLEEGVAGLILAPTSAHPQDYQGLFASGTPCVVIDRQVPYPGVDTVLVNGAAGSELAVDHLVQLGHSRIGYVGGLPHLSVMQARRQGFLAALEKVYFTPAPEYVRQGDNRQTGGYQAVNALLDLPHPPSAILIANNLMTLGGLQAIHERGLEIPGEVSVLGFDDMEWAPSLRPPLTVVAQPAFEMGELAARILLDRIGDPDLPTQTHTLDTHLIIRSSCRDLRNPP